MEKNPADTALGCFKKRGHTMTYQRERILCISKDIQEMALLLLAMKFTLKVDNT